jgi:anaerobic dimethyl sulfoxide reductase subunit B (iron-sulfur subunit)
VSGDEGNEIGMEKGIQKGFYLDLNRCTSCYACVVACRAHHPQLEEDVFWRSVHTLEAGSYPDVRVLNLSFSCMHCETPSCREICPANAISKRREDGIVVVDPKLCIGCKMCLIACPFGIPQFGKDGKMSKCNFCLDRLDRGMDPACTKVCPALALHAGTLEELSLITRGRSARQLVRMTNPSFFL